MFDEIKNVALQKLENAEPATVSEAVRQEIGAMPPAEVALHAQTVVTNLQQNGNTDLAKELSDLVLAAAQDPDALKRALIQFVEAHPDILKQFAPQLAERIFARL